MKIILRLLAGILILGVANGNSLRVLTGHTIWLVPAVLLSIVIQIIPSYANRKLKTRRLRFLADGSELLHIFLISTSISVIYQVAGWIGLLPLKSLTEDWRFWLLSGGICILTEAVTFWNGILRIYVLSEQLGIKWLVIGAICGMIPVIHLLVLILLIQKVESEIMVENTKWIENEEREQQKICQTKYPLLLVHGVFFRDSALLNYWGRIPGELEKNGATIYYGNHGSASSVPDSAKELDKRIREIVQQTGCGKVNIIAHSKGGLDCRYAMAELGTGKFVASLTTINTPHRGCQFADYLLDKIPDGQQKKIADAYNHALHKLGDTDPDFMAAVTDLTESGCQKLQEHLYDGDEVYSQSVGSCLKHPAGGRFPLNLSYLLVKYFDGENDGLVGEESFAWGQKYQLIRARGRRGISHGDMIDLNRENFRGFDVREFYVQLVKDLKEKGL